MQLETKLMYISFSADWILVAAHLFTYGSIFPPMKDKRRFWFVYASFKSKDVVAMRRLTNPALTSASSPELGTSPRIIPKRRPICRRRKLHSRTGNCQSTTTYTHRKAIS